MTSDRVPLMFQAQIEGRGQIQYIGDSDKAYQWVDQWIKGTSSQQVPQFDPNVKTDKYKITWRVVSNSGQDEGVIRPIIGAKGFPFYPGASMKGAFLRACTEEEALKYCGGKLSKNVTQPGILRFHGGYPKDWNNWTQKPLVDVVHPQEDWQVKDNSKHSAFIQISLYQPILVFGISSIVELSKDEWDTIWNIWKRAMERGIGSRTSAGYGQTTKNHGESNLLSVYLQGQGLASLLPNKIGDRPKGEFRPNMFKAALRGHTLRLFSGVTDQKTAEELTKQLWGGIKGEGDAKGSTVGLFGIAFTFTPDNLDIGSYEFRNNSMPTYELINGTLNLLCMQRVPDKQRNYLRSLATQLVKFSLLIGGFGKSWRRVDHKLFFEHYLDGNDNPMIGCHWQFTIKSKRLYVPVNDLSDITTFLNNLRNNILLPWLKLKKKTQSNTTSDWREAWHPKKVQVWGRIAINQQDSKAVRWFHSFYIGTKSIKETDLTGRIARQGLPTQIGRIWHRMYPHYITTAIGDLQATGKYVELLTIFPDNSDTTKEFLDFLLGNNSGFTKLWGEE
ncbi:hypothetical protein [Iningainema tapete]|uniref:RAMP superfamily protein n=1 Tax=Iningainema tapete BLCC-T55 TaxID=2748662 RepID=A0A8J6XCP4_9CYAN|nr:hypothetical protein [Iningainema tapete]MBD2772614.1 hypothetical protein [Iningainema tapete BLCC-T55]